MDISRIAGYLDSWMIHLRAERKSDQTLKTYGDGIRSFIRWAEREAREPALDRPTVNAFVVSLLDDGAAAGTARSRQLAVRRFSAWLAAEGEIDADQLVALKPPKLDDKVIPELDEQQLKALIATCTGKSLRDRRDTAIIRLMVETAARAGEVVAMSLGDFDKKTGVVIIRRGKGGKGRPVTVGPQTLQAIDRYLRMRAGHPLADTEDFWLGDRQKGFGYQGLYAALTARGKAAGLEGFHPHVLRHTMAGRWLGAGGSEGGLMYTAGWARRDMIDRYTRSTSQKRASEEARGLALGDW